MSKQFTQIDWDERLVDDCRQLIRLAVREDLDRWYDWTTVALIPESSRGVADVVVRRDGVLAGLAAAELTLREMDVEADWQPLQQDGSAVSAGTAVARMSGPARDLLTAERVVLNFLGRLSGIASLTRRYVDAVAGTPAGIYDTRKTTPGWRRLEKYAVRCGGGSNHRTGLFDAVLIKDNHLAMAAQAARPLTPADAVRQARRFLQEMVPDHRQAEQMIVEVEVDTLEQLDQVLQAEPDIVLLDNMTPDQLAEAVRRRDAAGVNTQLEASGGIHLESIRAVAESGVQRISVGALTHAAVSLDIGLDWK